MITDHKIISGRNCYCRSDDPTRKYRGIPDGFCGLCDIEGCGKPGHLAHYPGPVPVTMSFCDEHYIEEFRNPMMMD